MLAGGSTAVFRLLPFQFDGDHTYQRLGMAVRLAVDLGLHLDPQPYVQMGLLDAEEAMVRKMVWGGVFIHDR